MVLYYVCCTVAEQCEQQHSDLVYQVRYYFVGLLKTVIINSDDFGRIHRNHTDMREIFKFFILQFYVHLGAKESDDYSKIMYYKRYFV